MNGQRFAIYPYKIGSGSAKALATAMECKQIKHEGSRFRWWNDPRWWVINWGSSHCPEGYSVLNPSVNVVRATNKLAFFNLVKDYCRVPEYSSLISDALSWIHSSNKQKVVCRATLTGHSGQGITIAGEGLELTNAPLYVKYIPKDKEYRLHFMRGQQEPFFIQRKAKRRDFEGEVDKKIRSHANGWVFVHEPENVGAVPQDVLEQGKAAFEYSGLDFGGLDIIWSERQQKAYVLEANTACGLEGATVEIYANSFKQLGR